MDSQNLTSDVVSIENQIHAISWSRSVYERLATRAETFSQEELHWLWWNHHRSVIIDLRRLLDVDSRSVSLLGIVSFVWRQPEGSKLPSGQTRLNSDVLSRDLNSLKRLRTSIEAFANKCVAHSDRRDMSTQAPSFSEIDNIIEEIRSQFVRYRSLLTGNVSSEIGPKITWD